MLQGRLNSYTNIVQGVAAKDAKDSSVKKLFVIGAVPNVPENYFNVKVVMDQLNMEAVEFSVSADVKMCKFFILKHFQPLKKTLKQLNI